MDLAVGGQVRLTISDIAFGGEGVARVEDFVVFVPFVAVGEEIEAELTEVRRRFARARLLRVLQPAPERVRPPCRYFGECGGCQYQHLDYETQLQLKHKQVCDLFERIGHLDRSVVAPVIRCPAPYGYRNRIMVRTQWDKFKQGLNIGFLRADSRLVVDIEECRIAEPALNQQIERVRAEPPPKGGMKVVLRIAPEGWEVPPDSFFQNNFYMLPRLIEAIRGRLRDGGARHLADVYCGVGVFSIDTADLVDSFVGVEYDRLAVKAARNNAVARGLTNGEFVAGLAEEVLPGLVRGWNPAATAVLLDPPRKGCARAMLELLRETRPAQVIYVSCHPATMARDLNALCSDGVFKLAKASLLDMFPQTAHVECVADLRSLPARLGSAN